MGLPQGEAVRFKENELITWHSKLYSILTVRITKINKKQQIPFIAIKNEGQSIDYINEITGNYQEVVIDKITLEDYINFHDIEYEIIDGIYWDNGNNKKMGELINILFNERVKCKKNNNEALSNVLKLMLNSSYGKNGMKKDKIKKSIMSLKDKDMFNNYVYNNFNTITKYTEINKRNVEIEKVISDSSFNRGHIACAILSMSKRIMNEVFDVANDNDITIYYTDTDSIHMNHADIEKLENKYFERYGKVLNGKGLGQFHTDFNLKGAGKGEDIYATTSIFLGKKSYMDKLESKDKNGNIISGYHIRLKGQTTDGLLEESKKYKDSYTGLYTDLSEGKELNILLNPTNHEDNHKKVLFEFKLGHVRTKGDFYRKVKF